ncbi:MAG TPA: hypothetical protein VN743_04765 [Blastocatellia bacterium]|nr:hypothetical protein [Blastocatellia bacterium]
MLTISLSLALVVQAVFVLLDDGRLLLRRLKETKITTASDNNHTGRFRGSTANLVDIVFLTPVSVESLM